MGRDVNVTVVLVTGSQSFDDYDLLVAELTKREPTQIMHGRAKKGADAMATDAAHELHVSLRTFPADWFTHGGCRCRDTSPGTLCKYAGMRRNIQMINLLRSMAVPRMVLGFWDGKSSGTGQCLGEARKRGLRVEVVRFQPAGGDRVGQLAIGE